MIEVRMEKLCHVGSSLGISVTPGLPQSLLLPIDPFTTSL